MAAYLLRRLLLLVPTLFGIIAINFVVVQFAPGGPVEQMMAELRGHGEAGMTRMTGSTGGEAAIAAPAGSTRISSPTSARCSASTSRRSPAS
jgi:microcin C transport system permease protein